MGINIRGRSFLTLLDFTPDEINYLLDLSAEFKRMKNNGVEHKWLTGKQVVLLFEKTSTRTRCSFEVAATQEGAHVTYLDAGSSQMGKKESLEDSAKVLGRFFDGIEYRGFGQAIVQERMDALTKDKPFTTLQDVVDVLNEFPEVRGALQDPAIRVGEPGSYAGKVCVLFAGVTGGGAQVYNTFFDYGVGTLIVMHMPEDDIKAVAEHNKGNVIIAGHMASDSIGFNRVLDAWQAEGLEVTRIGGLVSSAGC